MSHAVPYPSLTTSDVDYVTKMQANLDYLRDLILLQQIVGADLSTSAAIANGQVAQYGLTGSSINTGSSGVPTAALVTGAVTEPKYGAASIVDGDIDWTSVKGLRTGATGIVINRGTKTVSYSSTTAVVTTVTFSTDSDEYIPFQSSPMEFLACAQATGGPSVPAIVITDIVSATTGTITVATTESTTWGGLSVSWVAIGI